MAKKILVSIDLGGNQIQNTLVHVLATPPTALGAGQIYFDTVIGKLGQYDGSTWHYIYAINDAGSATTDLWSADKIASEIATAVSGGVVYKGGYDAATNTPNLDATPIAILQGDMYTVTVAGTFFTVPVSVGDVLIAEIDTATVEADWTIVERNLNSATETSEGTTEIATQGETDDGVDDFRYVTPLKLKTWFTNKNGVTKFAVDLDGAGEASVVRAFGGGQTTFTVTHNYGSLDTVVQVKEISTGEEVVVEVDNVTTNTLDIIMSGNIADDLYRITIVA